MINDKGYSARPDVQDNLKKRRRWGFLQRLYAGLRSPCSLRPMMVL